MTDNEPMNNNNEPMTTLPTWLELLHNHLAREIPGFASEFGAVVLRPDLDATRVSILVRVLEEVALPTVPAIRWRTRYVVRGVIGALRSGDTEALRKAIAAAETTGGTVAWAATWAAVAFYAAVANAATWSATAAAEAAADARQTAWRRIADIVIEEVNR